ncbi:nucleotide exchange factor GrpE [Candidatus Dependentiae bacterium]|nr:nucleotide exchange factor GrpE [Candidatus Dependentiae bacterium]
MEETVSKEHTENTPETNTQPLELCQAQLQEWREKYLRVQADFDNFTRRIEKEKSSWMRVVQATMLKDMLTIVDDVERAFATNMAIELTPELQQWLAGFELIGKSLQKFLLAQGVEEISQMSTFDPRLHEALMQVTSADHASGSIVEVFQKGYLFKDEVLRPAKVSVAQ